MVYFDETLLYAFLAVCLLVASALGGAFIPEKNLQTSTQKIRKALMLGLLTVGLGFSLKAVLPAELKALQTVHKSSGKPPSPLAWETYSVEALSEARAQGHPVIIDIWADWCPACEDLEQVTYTDTEVQVLSKKFRLLKIDASKESQEVQWIKKLYRVVGLPTVVFVDGKGKPRWDLSLTGFEDAGGFLARMKKLVGEERRISSEE